MPEDFDLPIDGESDESSDDKPLRRSSASSSSSARRKPTSRKRMVRRAVPARDEYEEVAAPLRTRPRIAIDAATHAPRRVNLYRRLAMSFLAATVAVIAVIVFFTFQRASIKVEQESMPLAATLGVVIENKEGGGALLPAATSTAPIGDVFQGVVMTVTTSTQRIFYPTATTDKPGKARGTVTIHNTGPTPQALVATTRFLSDKGVLFRLVRAVTAPPRGTIEAELIADQPGSAGDIDPSRFTIPGLSATQQKIVYGVSSQAMTGGSSKAGVVLQTDIDRAQEDVRKDLLEIGQRALSSVQVPTGYELLYTTVNIKAESSAKSGQEVSQFSVLASGTMAFVAYPKQEVYAAADRAVHNKLPTPYHKVVFTSETPVVSLQTINVEAKTATLQIYREGKAVLDARSAAFQPAQFIGRSKQEIMDQLKAIKGVKTVDVALFPFWVERAPKVPSRVQVEIVE